MNKLIKYTLFLAAWFVSTYYFASFLTSGDQVYYREFYNNVDHFSFSQGYIFMRAHIGASEPIFYVIIRYAAFLIPKAIFISSINAILMLLCYKYIEKYKPSIPSLLLISTNIYIWALLISTERLKIACLFFIIALLLAKNDKIVNHKNIALYILSLLTHYQMILPCLIIATLHISNNAVQNGKLLKNRILKLIFLFLPAIIAASLILLHAIYTAVERKLTPHIYSGSLILDFLKPLILYILSLTLAKSRDVKSIDKNLTFLPIIFTSTIIGSSRIELFAFFLFFYYFIKTKKSLNAIFLTVCLYFSAQGIILLYQTVTYGNAFYYDYLHHIQNL